MIDESQLPSLIEMLQSRDKELFELGKHMIRSQIETKDDISRVNKALEKRFNKHPDNTKIEHVYMMGFLSTTSSVKDIEIEYDFVVGPYVNIF